jgi:hypothetical protein
MSSLRLADITGSDDVALTPSVVADEASELISGNLIEPTMLLKVNRLTEDGAS